MIALLLQNGEGREVHWSPVNWPTDNGPARLFGQFLIGPNQYQLYYLTTRIFGQNVEALLFGQFLEAKTAGQLTGLQCIFNFMLVPFVEGYLVKMI